MCLDYVAQLEKPRMLTSSLLLNLIQLHTAEKSNIGKKLKGKESCL